MDPIANPYNPGAGIPPPELAGRDELIEKIAISVERARKSRSVNNFMLLGLRGVGKTVLLRKVLDEASRENVVQDLEINPDLTLASQIAERLLRILIGLDAKAKIGHNTKKALGFLQSFAAKFEVRIGDYAVGVAEHKATGDLQIDLPDLFQAVGEAAKGRGVAIVLAIDEVQYLSREDLTALMIALHRVSKEQLPLVFLGAGLPQLAKLTGDAWSYAERLFDYPEIGRLDNASATRALEIPAREEGVAFKEAAIAHILSETAGYPYFIQVWGDNVWRVAKTSPITIEDAIRATDLAVKYLDESFFRIRLDRLTAKQQQYARAMAELGPGPVKTADVAKQMGIKASLAAPIRAQIVKKGMAYSKQRGEIAFSVPKFDEYLRRVMP